MREAFQGLRSETAKADGVPDFGSMLAEARRQAEARPNLEVVPGSSSLSAPRRRWARYGTWASAALAAALAGIIFVDRAPSGEEDFERLVAAYASQSVPVSRSPTSALLEVPGMELLRSMPSIGTPLRGLDPSTRPTEPSPEEENL